MRVKELITELLDMPMYADVQIAYQKDNSNYEYQDVFMTVLYDQDNAVGIVGIRG